MKLSGSQVESLHNVLLDAFNANELHRMTRIKLNKNLDKIASGTNLSDTTFELIGWAERQGCLLELITGVAQTSPGNQGLQEWIAANTPELSPNNGLESTRSVAPSEVTSSPEKIEAFKDRFASFEAKNELVNALLACPTVRDRDTRNSIVSNLPDDIRTRIDRSNTDYVDVMNIVSRTLDFSGGLTDFLARVRSYESDSNPMKNVNKLVS